jgi:hypothetical protein
MRRKQEEWVKLRCLRGAVKEGLDQLDRGEGVEFRSVEDLDAHINRLGKEASAEGARDKDLRTRVF